MVAVHVAAVVAVVAACRCAAKTFSVAATLPSAAL